MKSPALIIVVLPKARFPFHVAERNGEVYHVIAAFEERSDADLYATAVSAQPLSTRRKEASDAT